MSRTLLITIKALNQQKTLNVTYLFIEASRFNEGEFLVKEIPIIYNKRSSIPRTEEIARSIIDLDFVDIDQILEHFNGIFTRYYECLITFVDGPTKKLQIKKVLGSNAKLELFIATIKKFLMFGTIERNKTLRIF